MPENDVLVLYPYRYQGEGCSAWVFDDERTQLKVEAFVGGSSEILDEMLEANDLENISDSGFKVSFSAKPFEGHQVRLRWIASESDTDYDTAEGNYYAGKVYGQVMVGWLCPALGLYFAGKAPDDLYIRVEKLPEGVDPIWHTAAGKQFVAPGGTDGEETEAEAD